MNGVSSATLYLANLGTGTGTLSSTQLTGFHTSGVTYGGFGGVDLFLNPGTVTLNVVSTASGVTTTINASTGSATINVGNSGHLNGIAGPLVVNGVGGQNDVLNISDASDIAGQTGTLTASQVTGLGTAGIGYTNILQLNLTLGSGHNTFTVASTAGQTLTSIGTAAGSLSGTITIGNNLTQIQGPVIINGGGADTLVVSDSAAPGSLTGFLTSLKVTGLGMGSQAEIDYSNLAALTITLGGSSNNFSIVSTASVITTTLNAGVGNNTVVVQGTSGPTVVNAGTGTSNTVAVSGSGDVLTPIQGGVTVNGHGADTLQVDGRNDITSRNGSLTSSAIGGLGLSSAGIGYFGIGALTLVLGSGNDTFAVTSTITGSTTLVVSGGSDTVDLSGLNGAVVLNGGNGNNTVTVHSTNTGSTLTINEGTGSNWVAILTANGSVTVNEGSGTDVVEFGSNAATTPRGVDTGGNVNGIAGSVSVIGGAGSDSLYLDETGDSSSTGNNGTLTASTITGLGLGAGLSYSAQELVQIALGAGGTEFAVRGTSTQTTVDTGGGNDTIDVSSDAPTNLGSLGQLAGHLTIDGQGSGTDTLNISDFGDVVAGSGRLTSTDFTGFGTAGISYANVESLNIQLGQGGDELDITSTYLSAVTTIRAGPGSDTVNVSSDAPADLGTVGGIAGQLIVDGQTGVSDTLNVSDAGDTIARTGKLTSSLLTGLGLGPAGITYSNLEVLNVQLGQGGDELDIASTSAGTVTTIKAGPGSDTVNVSSDAPANLGNVGGIAGRLIVDGQTGATDTLNVSDAGDTAAQTGNLTSSLLTGLGLGSAGITYSNLEVLNIVLGSGGDTFTIESTQAGLTTLTAAAGNDTVNVWTVSGHTTVDTGTGADTVVVGSPAGFLDGISALLEIEGGSASDSFTAVDSGDPTNNTGTLTDSFLSGLGMLVGIHYTDFEVVTVNLGSGNDTFTVLSTATGATTTVNAGPGNDSVDVETISGPTFVNGQAGNDSITVNGDTVNPSTANGIGALLTLDGGAGSDTYTVNTFGNGDSTIDVFDTGGGVNTLTINGTAADDQFLFRAGLVASLTGLVGGAYTHAELVNYDGQITGGLTVNGLAGNDGFAFDDNSATTTVNGGDGNDTFQVGQLFGPIEHFITAVDLTTTTRGDLSNGISFATTLNGNDGNDVFSIFHNRAPLATNGDAGDDTFVIRTFAAVDEFTTLNSGDGSDLIQYVANAPLAIDGGDGFDTVLVIGTEFDDSFTITSAGVTGSGLLVSIVNVERVTIDGVEGNDHFTVLSTAATVDTWLYGGLGSDTFDIGDPVLGTTGIKGALHVFGGDDPNGTPPFPAPVLLPGESTGPLPIASNPNFLMIESDQVDTMNVNDGGVSAGQIGTLTSTSVSGLGMSAAGIVYTDLEAVNVHLGSGDDTFTIVSTHGGTTTLTGGDGNDALSVLSIAGPTLVSGDGGDDTITVGSLAATLTGIGSLLAIDGGTGSDRLVVNDSGDTADSLGTLTQTSLTGLGMNGVGSVSVYSVDPHGAAFTITLAGFGSASFAAGADAATVQAGLQQLMFPTASCGSAGTSRCSQSVFVWQLGGELLVGFQGEVAGAAPALTSTGTDQARGNGIDYANLENLDISLGSGNDRFNVRGTLPVHEPRPAPATTSSTSPTRPTSARCPPRSRPRPATWARSRLRSSTARSPSTISSTTARSR